jgi:O-succinylbenzoic acid--CoA ligase
MEFPFATEPKRAICWQGVSYQAADLLIYGRDRLQTDLPDWERSVYEVLTQWLDPSVERLEAFTSGSTGTPKAMFFSKASLAVSAQLTAQYFGLGPGSSCLLCLPARYIAGKLMIIRALVNGWDLWAVEPSGSPLTEVAVPLDFAAMIPLQVQRSLDEWPERFAALGQVIIGGAPIPPRTLVQLQASATPCFATYGMTETLTHLAIRPVNGPEASEVFQALPGFSLSLDERGCLYIEATHLPASAQTNDLVELIDETHFRWLGRLDHVINSGGLKLSPEQLEPKLADLIQERYYLRGEAEERLGECLVLVIEGPTWPEAQQAVFLARLNAILPRLEVPKKLVFEQKFEETATGKVKRKGR